MTMHWEIHEQPEVIRRVLESNVELAASAARLMAETSFGLIAARGTSDNAGRYAQYLWGAKNNYAVGLATPSLFSVYSDPPRLTDALVIGISQSGQSPDVVSVLAEARAQQRPTIALTNDQSAPLAVHADVTLPLHAGVERAVAATKTYTSELMNVALISTSGATEQLRPIEGVVRQILSREEDIAEVAGRFADLEHCAVIARGHNHATAFELALKLQELTYVVAQPFSSADFLHGPVAVLEEGYPVVVIATEGPTLSDLAEVIARCREAGARLLVVTDNPDLAEQGDHSIRLPAGVPEWLTPIPAIVAGQLFALHLTEAMGLDPESPRGLRKVTRTR